MIPHLKLENVSSVLLRLKSIALILMFLSFFYSGSKYLQLVQYFIYFVAILGIIEELMSNPSWWLLFYVLLALHYMPSLMPLSNYTVSISLIGFMFPMYFSLDKTKCLAKPDFYFNGDNRFLCKQKMSDRKAIDKLSDTDRKYISVRLRYKNGNFQILKRGHFIAFLDNYYKKHLLKNYSKYQIRNSHFNCIAKIKTRELLELDLPTKNLNGSPVVSKQNLKAT